jgi:hypothetical protein
MKKLLAIVGAFVTGGIVVVTQSAEVAARIAVN